MPDGAGVIRYAGKRGTVWRIKYRDAEGRQVMETLGAERDGWNRRKAEAELRERLVRVDRKGYRRPGPLTFAEYAATWFAEGESRRRWKGSTCQQYRSIAQRLTEALGAIPVAAVRPRHVAEYVAAASRVYGAATVSRDLSVLHAIFTTAQREELVETNPAARAERPKLPRRRWRILEPHEVPLVARSFADPRARLVFLVLILAGLRRAELRALRWQDVKLVEGVLLVRDSKTEEGIRSIALASTLVDELSAHWQRTPYKGDGDYVFAERRGGPLKADWYAEQFRAALATAGIADYVRPFHDARHSSLTNGAAGGEGPVALMARAGHRSMRTTQTYLHLAGVVFHDEAQALEQRLLGRVHLPTQAVEPSTGLT